MRKNSAFWELLPLVLMAAAVVATMTFAGNFRQWQVCEVVGNKLDNCRDATDGDTLDITLVALGLKPGWAVWRRR
jgi:hypothetical protein